MIRQCEECLDFIPRDSMSKMEYKKFVFCKKECLDSWKQFWEAVHDKKIVLEIKDEI